METEGPFVKVPIECVSQLFRKTRKTVTQELNAVVREVNNIAAEVDGDECGAIDDASARLGQLLDRLAKLKATAQQAAREEKRHLAGLRKRLELLAQPAPPPPPPPPPPSFPTSTSSSSPSPSHSLSHTPSPTLVRSTGSCLLPESPAERTRLDRCIVEYLLREGHSEAARELSEEAGIQDLVTIELFERAKEVEAAIRAKDLGPALQWCEDNASRLRKLESTLEFKVRERAFLEMVRANKREEAILYAREHLQVHAPGHAEEVQRAMTTLAFTEPVAAPVPEYAALFADERWEELASEFLVEMQGVFGLTQPSMLEIVLQCGITVVKTPQCLEDSNRVAHCPTCSVEGRALGEGLPCAHHGQSFLICRQSGDPIGADNPPMALPNGRVYGSRAIRALARPPAGIGGASGVVGSTMVTCPSTGCTYRLDQLRNVYII